jgi:hypothetical protein
MFDAESVLDLVGGRTLVAEADKVARKGLIHIRKLLRPKGVAIKTSRLVRCFEELSDLIRLEAMIVGRIVEPAWVGQTDRSDVGKTMSLRRMGWSGLNVVIRLLDRNRHGMVGRGMVSGLSNEWRGIDISPRSCNNGAMSGQRSRIREVKDKRIFGVKNRGRGILR